jgi:hypothetical protein
MILRDVRSVRFTLHCRDPHDSLFVSEIEANIVEHLFGDRSVIDLLCRLPARPLGEKVLRKDGECWTGNSSSFIVPTSDFLHDGDR